MDFLVSGAQTALNLTLAPAQQAAFQTYADLLVEWNARFNLTAITDPEGIQSKHFLDSLSCLLAMGRPADLRPGLRVIDVGTGAGFPGIPLKIVCPQIRLTLVEATGKKAAFCEAVVRALHLGDATVVKARAEEIGHDPAHREQYDWVVARAVAGMPVLLEYLLPLARLGGQALAQKGEGAPAEVQPVEQVARLLGGRLKQLMPVELPGIVETRYLVIFEKTAATPRAYPRRPGLPGKSPLR